GDGRGGRRVRLWSSVHRVIGVEARPVPPVGPRSRQAPEGDVVVDAALVVEGDGGRARLTPRRLVVDGTPQHQLATQAPVDGRAQLLPAAGGPGGLAAVSVVDPVQAVLG